MFVSASIFATVFLAILLIASRAQAAEVIYWDNYGADNVAYANIDGSGGGFLNLGSGSLKSPEGMAYDTVTNRLFVAGGGAERQILGINLDGSGSALFTAPGAPVEDPEGIAVDPATRTIYWANDKDNGSIAWAKLDGSAGGTLNTTGATLDGPCCRIAVDPVGGRVYWISGESTISYANLNNSGGGVLNLTGSTVKPGGEGIAVDSAAGRVYFSGGSDEIGFANVNGSGGGNVSLGNGVIDGPWGLAIDPSTSRLYWANESNGEGEGANAFGFVSTSSGVGGNINIANSLIYEPQDPVILKSPSGTGAPAITRSTTSRSSFECSAGTWAADYPGSFVYQAPRTLAYQWTRNGTPIAGATATTYVAKSAGSYACTVTATNQVGSAAQSSAAVKVAAAKIKLTAKKKVNAKSGGVAKLKVKAVNQGDIQSKKARVCVKLPKSAKGALKAPKCATLGKLKGRGKHGATIKVKVGKSAVGSYRVKFLLHGAPGKGAQATIQIK